LTLHIAEHFITVYWMVTNYVYFFPCTVHLLSSEHKSHNRDTTTPEKIFISYAICLAMHLYLWNDRTCVTADMIETLETVNQLTRTLGTHGRNLRMHDSFYYPTYSMMWQTESQLLLGRPSNKQLKQHDIHANTIDDLKRNTSYTHMTNVHSYQ
jgi:hypothetical protein